MMKWIIGVVLLATLPVTPAVGAGVMLDRSYGWKDGIGLSTLPLVQKTAGSISVRLINSGDSDETVPVTVLGSDNKTVIGSTTVAVQANGAAIAAISWTPYSNGWKRITVVAGEERASASVPVTVRRLYFSWYNSAPEFDRTLKYANVVLSTDGETHKYWESRGAIPCLWKGAESSVKFKTPDEYASYLVENISEGGAKGILIDEMGSYSECDVAEDIYYRGLAELTQRKDDLFVGLWVCGSLKAPFCNIVRNVYRNKGVNLLMLEAYLNFFGPELQAMDRYAYLDQRIQVARSQDVLPNTVIVLGVFDYTHPVTKANYPLSDSDLEDQVIYVRKHAPEMPGIGFFASHGPRSVVTYADVLCRKYYIDPVIAVWDRDVRVSNVTPKAGETVRISTEIYNIGGMDAKGVKVRFYDGNRKIAERTLSIPAGGGTPSGRATAVVDWNPSSGWRELIVEVTPPLNTSIVSGIATRRLFVR